jgi:hypothetical protein
VLTIKTDFTYAHDFPTRVGNPEACANRSDPSRLVRRCDRIDLMRVLRRAKHAP